MQRVVPGGSRLPANVLNRRNRRKGPDNPNNRDGGDGGAPAGGRQEEDYSDSEHEDYSDSEDEGPEDYKKGGYHPVRIGEKYKNGRYTVLRKLGWGHFSTVWLVKDEEVGEYRALKVQKSAQHYTEAARDEVILLTQLNEGDPPDSKHCVRLHDHFEHSGPHGRHVCLVFEVLGDNLLTLIKRYDYKGIPIPIVRNLAHQMLVALDYMHREREIIHTDFKPENVMMVEPLRDCTWELPSPQQLQALSAGAAQPAPATTAAPASASPSKAAAAGAAGQALTKNQKKKLKKKQRKAATRQPDQADPTQEDGEGMSDGEEESLTTTDVTANAESEQQGADGADAAAANGEVTSLAAAPKADAAADARAASGAEATTSGAEPVIITRPALTEEELLTAKCKVVDFGNACWTYKQFTQDVQTRQYRCPEVILGAKYSTPADMWSLACVLFELITGDLLFDPRSGDKWDRDEDHLALFMELQGRMPRRVYEKGKYARDYFNRTGELRHIKKLKFWPLDRVLVEKYGLSEAEAMGLSSFLMPMLRFVPEERATAAEMLSHPWLRGELPPPQVDTARSDRRPSRSGGGVASRSPSPRPHSAGKPRAASRESDQIQLVELEGEDAVLVTARPADAESAAA